jgi:hypothetical protein
MNRWEVTSSHHKVDEKYLGIIYSFSLFASACMIDKSRRNAKILKFKPFSLCHAASVAYY